VGGRCGCAAARASPPPPLNTPARHLAPPPALPLPAPSWSPWWPPPSCPSRSSLGTTLPRRCAPWAHTRPLGRRRPGRCRRRPGAPCPGPRPSRRPALTPGPLPLPPPSHPLPPPPDLLCQGEEAPGQQEEARAQEAVKPRLRTDCPASAARGRSRAPCEGGAGRPAAPLKPGNLFRRTCPVKLQLPARTGGGVGGGECALAQVRFTAALGKRAPARGPSRAPGPRHRAPRAAGGPGPRALGRGRGAGGPGGVHRAGSWGQRRGRGGAGQGRRGGPAARPQRAEECTQSREVRPRQRANAPRRRQVLGGRGRRGARRAGGRGGAARRGPGGRRAPGARGGGGGLAWMDASRRGAARARGARVVRGRAGKGAAPAQGAGVVRSAGARLAAALRCFGGYRLGDRGGALAGLSVGRKACRAGSGRGRWGGQCGRQNSCCQALFWACCALTRRSCWGGQGWLNALVTRGTGFSGAKGHASVQGGAAGPRGGAGAVAVTSRAAACGELRLQAAPHRRAAPRAALSLANTLAPGGRGRAVPGAGWREGRGPRKPRCGRWAPGDAGGMGLGAGWPPDRGACALWGRGRARAGPRRAVRRRAGRRRGPAARGQDYSAGGARGRQAPARRQVRREKKR
jgi:hypothetical protein